MLRRSNWFSHAALTAILLSSITTYGQDAADLFSRLDKNADGKLTKEEIPEDQARLFERLVRIGDKDKDGQLTKGEFLDANKPEEKPQNPPGDGEPGRGVGGPSGDARARFEMLDKNKDGKVSIDEFPEFAQERIKPMLERLGKTELTLEEFSRLPGPNAGRMGPETLFKQFDKNNDGKLTRDELPEQMRERAGQIFERLGKTELTQEEWARATARMFGAPSDNPGRQPDGNTRTERGELFKRIDSNGDGKITKEELPAEMRERVAPLFERLGKSELTQEDFARIAERFRGEEGARPERDAGRRPDANSRPEGERRDADRNPEEKRREGDMGRGPDGAMNRPRGPVIIRLLDKNSDGRISKSELEKLSDVFDELDQNHDGQIDPSELFGGPMGPPRDQGRPGAPERRMDEPRPDSGRRRPDGDGRDVSSDRNRQPERDRPREGEGSRRPERDNSPR